jgi:hypothetical protein
MNVRSTAILVLVSFLAASCSDKAAPVKAQAETETQENEKQPREDEIAEDCVAFLRATKVSQPATSPGADCPGCASEGAEVLAFREMKMDRMSCSDTACEVFVTLRAEFNSGTRGTIGGGLTAWIPQEQRQAYLGGHPPEGDQLYPVKITYKRTSASWRAIEFDRAEAR